jgi:hypothetical protein
MSGSSSWFRNERYVTLVKLTKSCPWFSTSHCRNSLAPDACPPSSIRPRRRRQCEDRNSGSSTTINKSNPQAKDHDSFRRNVH